MAEGYRRVSLDEVGTNPEKPGSRWELSSALGVDAFNLNVAVLEAGERLSQNQFHYHENQQEAFYVAEGRCRVEAREEGFELETTDTVAFEAGEVGTHVIYNPFEEPCRLVGIGWPPEGRHPVHQVETVDALLEERYGKEGPS
ncbi:cupin domain-containing protein [Natronorarus salvus]|uniref:cupin domain-containing protein n=1 Tax=Natronorarus salvus TaxID=3117733 RepID=UPI002F26A90F